MLLIVILTVLCLLLVSFKSVLLPIKAVIMNAVSIGASFGVVVWVFQDGHLSRQLDFTSTGFIAPPSDPDVGLDLRSLTDYEVFLLSRIREEWDSGSDNTQAVASGLQHTGRIITAAALLLMVVVAGFSFSGIVVMKMVGIGMNRRHRGGCHPGPAAGCRRRCVAGPLELVVARGTRAQPRLRSTSRW